MIDKQIDFALSNTYNPTVSTVRGWKFELIIWFWPKYELGCDTYKRMKFYIIEIRSVRARENAIIY